MLYKHPTEQSPTVVRPIWHCTSPGLSFPGCPWGLRLLYQALGCGFLFIFVLIIRFSSSSSLLLLLTVTVGCLFFFSSFNQVTFKGRTKVKDKHYLGGSPENNIVLCINQSVLVIFLSSFVSKKL